MLKKNSISAFAIIILFFAGNAFAAQSLLPEGLVIESIFMPGIGQPVGKIQLVEGEVVIIHADILRGYRAENNLPLFEDDTIITMENGRISLKFNDESMLSISSDTKLVINRSSYDPNRKSRSYFFGMNSGKIRFKVRKMQGFRRSNFKVKTATAIIGVRGSDFIIIATPELTEIITLKDTIVDLVSLTAPWMKPVLLKDFERSTVELDGIPSEVKSVPLEEIEKIKKEFLSTPEMDRPEKPESKIDQVKGRPDKLKTKESDLSKPESIKPFSQPDLIKPFNKPDFIKPLKDEGLIEIPDKPVEPETLKPEDSFMQDIIIDNDLSTQNENFSEQQDSISEEKHEDAVIKELPQFPVQPNR
ncbi:FecR domain-containing protein [Candidatus Magnetomoraceae bacterium gMMP-15]